MYIPREKAKGNENRAAASTVSRNGNHVEQTPDFADNRPQSPVFAVAGIADRFNSSDEVLQRKLIVNGSRRRLTRTAWPNLVGLAPIAGLTPAQRTQARAILNRWLHASASSVKADVTSENRNYGSWAELAEALAGEVLSAANLAQEGVLAGQAQVSPNVLAGVGGFMTRLQAWHAAQAPAMQADALEARGRYRIYYGTSRLAFAFGRGTTLDDALIANLPAGLNQRIAIASDYALFARHYVAAWNPIMTANQAAARSTHWNPDETAAWTINARVNNVPLSAGPSATTMQVMELGLTIGALPNEMEGMAWGLFSFFNQGLNMNYSGTHRFHEVMAVADNYGVPYAAWVTPAASI